LSTGAPPLPRDARRGSAEDTPPAWRDHELRVVAASLTLTIAVGTAFYQIVEGWTPLNAVYFCVVTLATVGYGDLSPKTNLGKLFTMAYIIVGIGLLAAFAQVVARRWIDRRIRRLAQRQPPAEPTPRHARPRLTPLKRARRARRSAPVAATVEPAYDAGTTATS